MSLVYKGDVVLVNCTNHAGPQGQRATVDSTHYGTGATRYHIGVRPDVHPDEVYWHGTACLELIQRAELPPPVEGDGGGK